MRHPRLAQVEMAKQLQLQKPYTQGIWLPLLLLLLLFFWGQALEHDSSLVCQASHAKLLQNKWHMRAVKLQMPTASSNCRQQPVTSNCNQQPATAAAAVVASAAAALMIRLSSQSWRRQLPSLTYANALDLQLRCTALAYVAYA